MYKFIDDHFILILSLLAISGIYFEYQPIIIMAATVGWIITILLSVAIGVNELETTSGSVNIQQLWVLLFVLTMVIAGHGILAGCFFTTTILGYVRLYKENKK